MAQVIIDFSDEQDEILKKIVEKFKETDGITSKNKAAKFAVEQFKFK